ncbi:nicotinamide mononucleotide transporter [Halpernia humi]|uniref:Nicotinamide riboside transporter PnuC n=1 Tax=Halpernia humi TaxID=493375 RepID=A0A1H5TKX8_9FLAO|nr:nicotinamide riboside transporter PnuC [Halpernia humi]SEF63449.1 nicotinamide mononucleotide transporter [Halpernia humi]
MNFYDLFLKPYETYTHFQIFLESTGATFGILSVYFSVKKNIWVYPTGIISTAIYIYIMFQAGYLGDMMINFYYTVMSIYGWVLWSENSKDHIHIEVEKADKKTWQYSFLLFVISMGLVILIYYFKPYIDNRFSMDLISLNLNHMDKGNWMDVFTTSIFLVGMWLMAKRKVENWIFWIVGDLICIPMLIYRGLGITSVQYLIFTIMAVLGYITWKKDLETKAL